MGQYEAGKFTVQAWWESDEGRVRHDGLCSYGEKSAREGESRAHLIRLRG